MKRTFRGGEILVEYEPAGMNGRPCVLVAIPHAGIKLRLTLEDAESLGEAMVRCVRMAEEAGTAG